MSAAAELRRGVEDLLRANGHIPVVATARDHLGLAACRIEPRLEENLRPVESPLPAHTRRKRDSENTRRRLLDEREPRIAPQLLENSRRQPPRLLLLGSARH